jgi:O-antigen ligase
VQDGNCVSQGDRRLWNWTVVVLLAWGALSLGATRPWGYVPLIAGMAIHGAVSFAMREGANPVDRKIHFSLAMVCLAIGLQLLPLPGPFVKLISPAMVLAAHEGAAPSQPLSVDPGATALGLTFVAALALFFIGTARTMGAGGARRLAAGLVGLGTIMALVGIAETATSWPGFYRMAGLPLPPDSTPLGPFSSKNHYAGWMLMTLALAMGYLCAIVEGAPGLPSKTPTTRLVLVQCALAVMALAMVQTRSRAGIAGFIVTTVIMGGLLFRRHASTRTRTLVAVPLMLLPLTAIVVTGMQPIATRFAAETWSTAHGRLPIWRQAATIARDFPVAGSGFNTYGRIVPRYPAADLDEPYEGAHNDFLQLAVEGGLLVGLPVLAALGIFAWETRQRFRDSIGDDATRWIRTGAVVGLLLMVAQETVDFSLQVPGNAALFAVLAAIAVHRAPLGAYQLQGRSYPPTEGIRVYAQ